MSENEKAMNKEILEKANELEMARLNDIMREMKLFCILIILTIIVLFGLFFYFTYRLYRYKQCYDNNFQLSYCEKYKNF